MLLPSKSPDTVRTSGRRTHKQHFVKAVQYVYDEREEYIQTLKESKLNRAIPIIMNLIKKYS